jgi:hypothetical protein
MIERNGRGKLMIRTHRHAGAILFLGTALIGANAAQAAGNTFFEPFTWQGNHAAVINGGAATTVWWNENNWDVRGDTSFNAIDIQTEPPPIFDPVPLHGYFYHADIHKALHASPLDGREANNSFVVGGDGSPGVGAMRLDFQSVVSARLRNPMLISAGAPGVVTFYAPKFVTTGHWWEVAITPAAGSVTAGEHTAIPSAGGNGHGFDDPFGGGNPDNRTPGPGHYFPSDSINLIMTGYPDGVFCDNAPGWRVRFGATRAINGVTKDYIVPVPTVFDLPTTDPSEADELYKWKIRYFPGRVEFYGDLDKNGTFELLGRYNMRIPWSEVYVHLIGAGYQAGHHPFRNCGFPAEQVPYQQVREDLDWRNITVSPVKYASTTVLPRQLGTDNIPRSTGWLAYDTRDTQRFGAPVNGLPQANEAAYQHEAGPGQPGVTWALCAGVPSSPYCPDTNKGKTFTLKVSVPAASLDKLARAQFVYDIRCNRNDADTTSRVRLVVNGHAIGTLPLSGHQRPPGIADIQYLRKSVDVPANFLAPGVNRFSLWFVDEPGEVFLDRMQLELDTAA